MKIPQTKIFSPSKKFKGKKVLLRLSLNVPIKNGIVSDDFRLKRLTKILTDLQGVGAKTLVLSHLGEDGKQSLSTVVDYLKQTLSIGFLPTKSIRQAGEMLNGASNGSVIVLENIRRFEGEVNNDVAFAKELASIVDYYINEDFAVSHRKHASIVGIPKFLPSFVGPVFAEEVKNLSIAFKPKHPFLVILGGAKFKTKLPLVKKFLNSAENVFVGGALANSFYKELGYQVGRSLVDKEFLGLARLAKKENIILPKDVTVGSSGSKIIKLPSQVSARDNILDVGPETLDEIEDLVKGAKLILWNGPMGNFEKGFTEMTDRLARAIASSGATSLIGGGDTIASISKLGLVDEFSFVSTGGGAMLDFLANSTLPGLEAVLKSKK